MRIEKKTLNDALRVLGKVVCHDDEVFQLHCCISDSDVPG